MNTETAVLALLAVVLAAGLAAALHAAPARASRLRRFARREHLPLTERTAVPLTRYLTVTRRWRATFLALGLCYGAGLGLRSGQVRLDVLAVLGGWFAGALVAEWRLSAPLPAGPRTASLAPRRLAGYLPLPVRLLPAAVVLAALAVAVHVLVATEAAPARFRASVVAVAAGALLVLLAAAAVARRIVLRPQPVAGPESLGVDEALRRRSLHVLAGCVTALAGTALASLCTLVPSVPADGAALGGAVVLVAVFLLGLLTARSAPAHGAVPSQQPQPVAP
ncbi:hypothetical protein [Kineococcus gypseus]|uniref:hypothetical protein n=1 Tax=Kineococcus gypseus TaxID=1637102 RepID=UPI003D7D14AB